MSPVQILELLLALLSAAVLLSLLARAASLPAAAVYVLGGGALALVPGVPTVTLDPALIMTLFLPPLLQSSAYFTNWHEFRANLRPILLLAVGCVAFTTAVVAVVLHALLPALPWSVCVAFGAIVSPPDAVSATAILARLRIPRRLVSVIEGESLVNDATGLVIFRIALAVAMGAAFDPARAALAFVVVASGGVAVGLAVAWVVGWLLRRLGDTQLEIAASFLAAWTSYIAAEALGASGVLSTVACGLLLGHRQHETTRALTRIESQATWRFAVFVFEAMVFVLIGLSLRGVLARLGMTGALPLLPLAAWVTLAAIVARIVWVFPATYLPRMLVPAIRRADPYPPMALPLVLSWAGMRGVVSLAAALALPETVPARDILLFLTFAVIVATVLIQGTTLGPLIRLVGLIEPDDGAQEAAARAAIAAAEIAALEARTTDVMDGVIAADVLAEYRRHQPRAALPRSGAAFAELQARTAIRLSAMTAGRQALAALRRERRVSEHVLHALERDLDLEELRARRTLA